MIFPLTFKKTLWILLIGFLLYFLFQSPVEAGTMVRDIVKSVSDAFVSGAESFSTFLRTL